MVTTIEPVDNNEVTQEELEEELKEYYRECDKLLFISLMLALREPLPEGLNNEEYTKENTLEVISGHIEELEKLVSEFNSPVGYLGLDLKSAAVVLAMALIAPEAKEKIVKQLLLTYNDGQSEKNAHQKFYTFNLDRCVKLVYAYPGISREELPLLSSLLRHIAANPNDTMSGPFLTIRSLVDLSKVEFKDLGSNYRNLLREEIEMAKKATSRKTTAKTQVNKIEEVATTTTEVGTEKVTTKAVSNKQEQETVEQQLSQKEENTMVKNINNQLDAVENELMESAKKEGLKLNPEKMKEAMRESTAKMITSMKELDATKGAELNKTIEEVAERFGNMDPYIPGKDLEFGKNVKNIESWTNPSKSETSTLKKVLIGAAAIAAVGGIGYVVYDKFLSDDNAAFDNGVD